MKMFAKFVEFFKSLGFSKSASAEWGVMHPSTMINHSEFGESDNSYSHLKKRWEGKKWRKTISPEKGEMLIERRNGLISVRFLAMQGLPFNRIGIVDGLFGKNWPINEAIKKTLGVFQENRWDRDAPVPQLKIVIINQ